MGSPAVARWIAHLAFVVLMVRGWNELGLTRSAIFLLLWLIGFVGLRHAFDASLFFSPYVAVLDIALVFLIFKGDVKLS